VQPSDADDTEFIYFLTTHIITLSFAKLYFNSLYQKLIESNIIQKNVMLVGTYEEIKKYLPRNLIKFLYLNVAWLQILKT